MHEPKSSKQFFENSNSIRPSQIYLVEYRLILPRVKKRIYADFLFVFLFLKVLVDLLQIYFQQKWAALKRAFTRCQPALLKFHWRLWFHLLHHTFPFSIDNSSFAANLNNSNHENSTSISKSLSFCNFIPSFAEKYASLRNKERGQYEKTNKHILKNTKKYKELHL